MIFLDAMISVAYCHLAPYIILANWYCASCMLFGFGVSCWNCLSDFAHSLALINAPLFVRCPSQDWWQECMVIHPILLVCEFIILFQQPTVLVWDRIQAPFWHILCPNQNCWLARLLIWRMKCVILLQQPTVIVKMEYMLFSGMFYAKTKILDWQ